MIQKCSNCGKDSEYTEEELKAVFPFSRERLICKHCNHPLSVCSGYAEDLVKNNMAEIDDDFKEKYFGDKDGKNKN